MLTSSTTTSRVGRTMPNSSYQHETILNVTGLPMGATNL
ncbi:hypothetical protein TIFTF001_032997 [Ficus carica]|uniref:Uncharacterized protein n=1 Tax=Ficus carica TaxID=3494 RepID=A0AA88DXP0_FICCA|nr:hypothetical protein TIFTF001_032997 [Ficus carica]